MKVTNVERIIVDVPFTPRQQEITRQSVYNWSILELCKVETDTGHVAGARPLFTTPMAG